jgi:signal transduction histidine kinase
MLRRLLARLARSVRVRVTATAILAVGAALAVSAVVLDAGLQHDRQHILRATAEEQANNVVDYNPDLAGHLFLPRDATIESGLLQVLRNGRVVAASRPLRGLPPLWSADGGAQLDSAYDSLGTLAKDVQVVAVPVRENGVKDTVVVVVSLEQYDHSIAYLQRLLFDGTPILLVIVGVISWLVVGRALRPIEMMRREVAEVAGVSREYRVAEPGTDDEVGRLARTLNSMLDRIQAASDRERRFVSDASHELRSPIANIRTELEVALHHPRTADWDQVASDVLTENERMEKLVSGLLLLARSDEGTLPPSAGPVDLVEAVAAVIDAPGGGPVPRLEVTSRPWVWVPEVYLERMVSNLVDNARRFAATAVWVSVGDEDGWAVVRVRDDGPGIAEEDRQRVFERFVRLDEARDRGVGGFGLGLAIVADLSRFYGGTISVEPSRPGAELALRLPRAAEPARGLPTPASPLLAR